MLMYTSLYRIIFFGDTGMVIEIILIIIIVCLLMVIMGYKREFRNIAKQIDNHLDDYVNIKLSLLIVI